MKYLKLLIFQKDNWSTTNKIDIVINLDTYKVRKYNILSQTVSILLEIKSLIISCNIFCLVWDVEFLYSSTKNSVHSSMVNSKQVAFFKIIYLFRLIIGMSLVIVEMIFVYVVLHHVTGRDSTWSYFNSRTYTYTLNQNIIPSQNRWNSQEAPGQIGNSTQLHCVRSQGNLPHKLSYHIPRGANSWSFITIHVSRLLPLDTRRPEAMGPHRDHKGNGREGQSYGQF